MSSGAFPEEELRQEVSSSTTVTTTIAATNTSDKDPKDFSCRLCDQVFPSRNSLFKHVKRCEILRNTRESVESSQLGETVATYLARNPDQDVFIYVTGGRVRGRTLGSVERYSFQRQQWEMCPYLLENRGSHGCASLGKCIFVIGGGGFRSNLSTCEMLDIGKGTWTPVAPMNSFRHALAVIAVPAHNSIYAIGGWADGTVCSADCERLDILTNTWHTCAPMGTPRRLLGATTLGDFIYTFGGNCGDGDWYSAAVERFDWKRNVWESRKDLPFAGPTSAATVGNFIFVFFHGRHIARYCPSTDTFVTMSNLPLADWFCFDVTSMGHIIYVHGGATANDKFSKALFSYDTRTDEWLELPSMLRQRRRCAAALVAL